MANSLDGPLIILVAVWICALIAIAGARFASQSKFLLDNPNHRSSHTSATSKAGGIPIIAAWLAGLFVVGTFVSDPQITMRAYQIGAVAGLALLLGALDDYFTLSPVLKLMGQFSIAWIFVSVIGPLIIVPAPFVGEIELNSTGSFVTAIWIVVFMNAYNFMDGANGIAAGCAIMGLSGLCVIAAFSGATFLSVTILLLAVGIYGFLPFNLMKGRLFMGDNGSQSVSFLIAAFAVMLTSTTTGRVSAYVVPMIFLPFLFDVFFTLTHRVARRQNIADGHREHIYQLLLRFDYSHEKVAAIYIALTAISTAAAVLMLALAPGEQWIAPILLCFGFSGGALIIYNKAREAGFFVYGLIEGVAGDEVETPEDSETDWNGSERAAE